MQSNSNPSPSASSRWATPTYPQHRMQVFHDEYHKPMEIVYHYQGSLSDFDPSRSSYLFPSFPALFRRVLEYNSILVSRGQAPLSTIHYLQYKCPRRDQSVVTIFEMSNGVNVKWIRQDGEGQRSPKYLFGVYDPVKDKWSMTQRI